MNRIKITLTTALFLLFAAFTYAQEPSQEPKPPQHEQPASAPEPNREVAPPAQQPEVAPPAHPNEARSPRQQEEAKPPRQEKPEKPEAQQKPEGEKPPRDQNKPAHEQHGQQPQKGQQAQTGQRARPAGKSAHIPDPKLKASFGREHHFTVNRVIHTTTIVPGRTQFVLVGYTFIVLDPWPAEWAFTDDCYIDYVDDDYFLFDVLHPGIRVALFVVG